MQVTSYFIGLAIQPECISDLFVRVYHSLQQYSLEWLWEFQNPLSPHITLYYFGADMDICLKDDIQHTLRSLSIHEPIHIVWWDYFLDEDGNPSVLYCIPKTRLPLEDYRYEFHKKWQQTTIWDNTLPFIPHMTFLKIRNPELFAVHRKHIEAIMDAEIQAIRDVDVNARNIALYAVNSCFREEIQIRLS